MHTVSSSRPKAPFYIDSLDGIRSIAFLIVFIAHSGAKSIIPGGFGVTIFFFLSGYLITTLLRMEFEKTGSIHFRNFFIRRSLRILPSQFIVLGIAIVLSLIAVLPVKIHAADVMLQFLNFTNYLQITGHDAIPHGTGVYWSLSVEEHFYLLFPFFFYYLTGRLSYRQMGWLFLAICLLILCWRIVLVCSMNDFELRINRGTDTRIDSILFGCILGVVFNPKLDKVPFKPFVWKYILFPSSSILLLMSFIVRTPEIRETVRYTIQGIALFPIFICAVTYSDTFLFKPFNLRIVRHFGKLTYVLYLIHIIVLYLVGKYITENMIVKSLTAFLMSVVIAQLFYVLIEKPLASLRHRYSGSGKRRADPQTVEALTEPHLSR